MKGILKLIPLSKLNQFKKAPKKVVVDENDGWPCTEIKIVTGRALRGIYSKDFTGIITNSEAKLIVVVVNDDFFLVSFDQYDKIISELFFDNLVDFEVVNEFVEILFPLKNPTKFEKAIKYLNKELNFDVESAYRRDNKIIKDLVNAFVAGYESKTIQ